MRMGNCLSRFWRGGRLSNERTTSRSKTRTRTRRVYGMVPGLKRAELDIIPPGGIYYHRKSRLEPKSQLGIRRASKKTNEINPGLKKMLCTETHSCRTLQSFFDDHRRKNSIKFKSKLAAYDSRATKVESSVPRAGKDRKEVKEVVAVGAKVGKRVSEVVAVGAKVGKRVSEVGVAASRVSNGEGGRLTQKSSLRQMSAADPLPRTPTNFKLCSLPQIAPIPEPRDTDSDNLDMNSSSILLSSVHDWSTSSNPSSTYYHKTSIIRK